MIDRLPRNEGKNSLVAFVFSCPGSLEEKNKQLVQGQTGHNLNRLIGIIREEPRYQYYFNYENRFDYRITNSSNLIHYKAKDGVSEPSNGEIMSLDNLSRLIKDLKGFELVITFGDKAKLAVNSCRNQLGNPHIINVRHLGFQSINQIKKDCNDEEILSSNGDPAVGKQNTKRRLEVIAKEILFQLEEKVGIGKSQV